MKEIIYPQRLKETIVGKGDLSYIRTAHIGTPPPGPITCIPTNHNFTDDLMNFDLVSTVDVRYQFYTIIETSDGKRFFLRIEDNVIPMNSVTVNVYDDNEQLVPMRLTAAAVITEILGGSSTSISGFNEPFYSSHLNAEFVQIIQNLVYRCDIGMLKLGPGEEFYNIIINSISGLTLDSPIPDFFMEIGNMENLRFIKESYTFKFARATLDDIERYGIVNNGSRRTINIIDYINGGDEIVLQSCARIELLIDSNPNPEPEPINCIPDEFTIKAIDIADPNIKKVRMRCYLTVDGIPDDYWNFKPDNSEIGYIECSYTRPSTSKPIYGRDILFEYFNVNDFFGPAIHSFFYGTDTIVNGNLSKITLKGLTVNSNVGNPNEVRVDQAVVKLSFIPITDLASDEIDFTILQWGSEQTFHSCAKIVWIDEVT